MQLPSFPLFKILRKGLGEIRLFLTFLTSSLTSLLFAQSVKLRGSFLCSPLISLNREKSFQVLTFKTQAQYNFLMELLFQVLPQSLLHLHQDLLLFYFMIPCITLKFHSVAVCMIIMYYLFPFKEQIWLLGSCSTQQSAWKIEGSE